MTKDMTIGKPLKLILHFMLPLLLGNLFQQTYNVLDAIIVGRTLGVDALAGVGSTSSIQFLIFGFCIGLTCGFSIPIAQCFGAKDYKALKKYVFHAEMLTVLIAIIITVTFSLICSNILHWLQVPDEIFTEAYDYLIVIFLGLPATLAYNIFANLLRSVGNSITPFICLAISTGLNIVMDLVCIIVFGWGVTGAACATVFSQIVSALLCYYIIRKKNPLICTDKEARAFSQPVASKLLAMGLPMGLQYSITAIGSMIMQGANNGLGTIYVSGFTTGTKIKQFLLCPYEAIGSAVSVYCGQNLGAAKFDRIKKGLFQGASVSVLYGIAAGLVMIFLGKPLSTIFLTESTQEVLSASAQYLKWMGYFFFVPGILITVRMGIQGLGYSGRAIFAGVLELIARSCVSIFLVPVFGFNAICCSDQTAWCSGCIYILIITALILRKLTKTLGQR